MKIENLPIAIRLSEQLKQVDSALLRIKKPLSEYTSNGANWSRSSDNVLYNLNITQHSDNSGFNVDLTGCCVGIEILRYTEQLLLAKKSDILTELAAL